MRPKKDMEINLDRPRRFFHTVSFWLFFIAVATLLGFLLMRFTGSMVIAIGLAGGMLLYMLIAGAVTSKHMSQSPGDGRLN